MYRHPETISQRDFSTGVRVLAQVIRDVQTDTCLSPQQSYSTVTVNTDQQLCPSPHQPISMRKMFTSVATVTLAPGKPAVTFSWSGLMIRRLELNTACVLNPSRETNPCTTLSEEPVKVRYH